MQNNYYISHGEYGFHKGLSCWSPVLNILRDPRWGRNQVFTEMLEFIMYEFYNIIIKETYGEDPWLTGHLGRAYVRGLQGGE